MSDNLADVTLSPTSIKSGGTTTATLRYQSDAGGLVHLVASNDFNVTPSTITLAAGGNLHEEVLKIDAVIQQNGDTTCYITFTFVVNFQRAAVLVTR